MKNVAIIISSLKGGGAERVVANITSSLPANKYNIYLMLFDSEARTYNHGGKLIDLNIKAHSNPFKKIINLFKRIVKLKKLKKRYKIDTSISFLPGPNIVNLLTRLDEKIIISIRSYPSRRTKNIYSQIRKYLIKKLYNYADLIVSVSKLIKEDLINNYNIESEKIAVIYNPYDLLEIKNLSIIPLERNDIDFDDNIIITVGRLNQSKGQWHLIRSFKNVVDYDNNAKLLIIGEGELRDYLQNLIEGLGLEKNVFLLGFTANPHQYVKKSSIFVLPSLTEGFPNALLEAMSNGLPIISSDCKSGPREILAPTTNIKKQTRKVEYGEYGILIPVCDGIRYDYSEKLTQGEELMADSIIGLLKDEKLHSNYSKKSLVRSEEFSTDKIIKRWEKIID